MKKLDKGIAQSILRTLADQSIANQHLLQSMRTIQAEIFAGCDPKDPSTADLHAQGRQLGNMIRSVEHRQVRLDRNIRSLKAYVGALHGKSTAQKSIFKRLLRFFSNL